MTARCWSGAPSPPRVDGWIQPVPGLTGVRAVAAGGGHSLALFTDGTVRAWGTTPGACLETEGPTPRPGRCGWWG
ncbi:hypothetical protein D7V80_02305 [Corallococcus sp. CA054B]|nr:hypothetical protein D7V80_02305 [Corallococcus sp. CA054B]